MLKSVIYMHRFQLNDASERSPRAAPKADGDGDADAHDHTHTHASPHDNDVGKWGTQIRVSSSRIESSRALKRLSRPQVKQTIKACKRENKRKMRRRKRRGNISMKEMQLGAKEWSRSGSQVGCQKNDYLNKSLLESCRATTATELSLSRTRGGRGLAGLAGLSLLRSVSSRCACLAALHLSCHPFSARETA